MTDAAANGDANYVIDASGGLTAGRVGHGVISMLALALVVAARTRTPSVPPATVIRLRVLRVWARVRARFTSGTRAGPPRCTAAGLAGRRCAENSWGPRVLRRDPEPARFGS